MILRIHINIKTWTTPSGDERRSSRTWSAKAFRPTPSFKGPNMQDVEMNCSTEIRCRCGNLLARWHVDGIELNCRRCRILVMIPFSQVRGTPPTALQL